MAALNRDIANHTEYLKKLVANSTHSFNELKDLVDYVINLKDSQ